MTVAYTYGIFGTPIRPASTDQFELYAPATGVEFIGEVIINNQDTVARVYHLAVCTDSGAAAVGEWIHGNGTNGQAIAGNTTHRISIRIKSPQTLRAIAGTVDIISFQCNGMTKTTT